MSLTIALIGIFIPMNSFLHPPLFSSLVPKISVLHIRSQGTYIHTWTTWLYVCIFGVCLFDIQPVALSARIKECAFFHSFCIYGVRPLASICMRCCSWHDAYICVCACMCVCMNTHARTHASIGYDIVLTHLYVLVLMCQTVRGSDNQGFKPFVLKHAHVVMFDGFIRVHQQLFMPLFI
jgi:hypothetical protein